MNRLNQTESAVFKFLANMNHSTRLTEMNEPYTDKENRKERKQDNTFSQCRKADKIIIKKKKKKKKKNAN